MDSNGTRWDRVDRPYKREERRVRSPRLTSVRMLLWCFASPLPLWYLVLLASSFFIPSPFSLDIHVRKAAHPHFLRTKKRNLDR